jgi:nitrite reductase (NADH) small subunit
VRWMAEWLAVCRLDEIPDGRGRSLEAAGLRIAVLRVGDQVFALAGRCPHAGGSLGDGWIEEDELVCPLHHWRFKLADGRCTSMPGEGVHRFRCQVREEDVWVEV